jgi:GNAT superfamily N-acetyltransferase
MNITRTTLEDRPLSWASTRRGGIEPLAKEPQRAMRLTFTHDADIEATMIFDDQYEEVLQLTVDAKRDLLRHTFAVWLYCDGELAGEIYGLSPKRMSRDCGEEIEDTDESDDTSVYVFSTTILPRFEGRGLATILKAYFQGFVKARGYTAIVGHATSPAMVRINGKFGATFGRVHENWYGTQRVAHFYRIAL